MRTRSTVLLLAAGLGLAACGGTKPATPADTDEAADTAAATRTVTDVLGEVEVPADPQRVVTLDQFAFEAAAVLDVPVVGAVVSDAMADPRSPLAPHLEGVERVGGAVGEPQLEAIVALEPDLVVGSFPNETELDEQLAAIAPTYLGGFSFETSGQWKEILLDQAALYDREGKAEDLLAEYERRATTVGEQAGGGTVASVRAYPDNLRVYGPDSFAGTVVDDAGLSLFEVEGGDEFGADISFERLPELTADTVIVWTANEADPEAVTDELQRLSFWRELPAVAEGRTTVAGPWWIGSGLLGAGAVLDDLERAVGAS